VNADALQRRRRSRTVKIKDPHRRLSSLWGRIDRQHNEWIAAEISGGRVLDVGCGYGSLTEFLRHRGYESVGIDDAAEFIDIGHRMFPRADLRVTDPERLDFRDDSFDAVVLKDVMHHLYTESDWQTVLAEIRRVLRPGGTLVVFDPNPHWILRVGRKLIRHRDPECTSDQAQAMLAKAGFTISRVGFYESVGIVLSGGYVGLRLCPNLDLLNTMAVKANAVLTRVINHVKLERALLFRYLIKAIK
jgi:SAM-dependent methyltransferase